MPDPKIKPTFGTPLSETNICEVSINNKHFRSKGFLTVQYFCKICIWVLGNSNNLVSMDNWIPNDIKSRKKRKTVLFLKIKFKRILLELTKEHFVNVTLHSLDPFLEWRLVFKTIKANAVIRTTSIAITLKNAASVALVLTTRTTKTNSNAALGKLWELDLARRCHPPKS
jgi:hypothetical protein